MIKREMNMNDKQNWVTMITPFTKDGEVDYDGIDNVIEWYIENGIDGIFSVCQSSEMFFLSLEERVKIAQRVMNTVNGRIPVVVSGHISDSIEEQIRELTEMSKIGSQAVVMVTNRLAKENESDDVWINNAKKILDAIPDVNFGLYECPFPYKRLLSEKIIKWCISTGRFLFIKDTSCDIELFKKRIDMVKGSGCKLYNANTTTLFESLRNGADGFCGVMLNFHPELYRYLVKHSDETNNEKVDMYQQFATIASLIERQLYPVNAKYNMMINGVKITYYTRSKDFNDFNDTMRSEVEQLDSLWKMLKSK